MSKLKAKLTDEAMDALEDVQDGLMSYEDYVKYYDPYGLTEAPHDCKLGNGEHGCPDPSHQGEPDV